MINFYKNPLIEICHKNTLTVHLNHTRHNRASSSGALSDRMTMLRIQNGLLALRLMTDN
jgi:hypothetical protein